MELPNQIDFLGLCFNELKQELNLSSDTIKNIWKNGKSHFFKFPQGLPQIISRDESIDGTIKYLFRLGDGERVEGVFIPFFNKDSICLSTQVGCPLKCSFCATGTLGFKRNLKAYEIVGTYLMILGEFYERTKKENPLPPNIVFMGQGEPLLNLKEVKKVVNVLTDKKLLQLGIRQITLSTSGYLPGIQEIVNDETFPKINFALSLHSPIEEERSHLIPLNNKFPLADVLEGLNQIKLLKRQFITIEYLILKGVNHSNQHAEKLIQILKPLQEQGKVIVNLILFNEVSGIPYERPLESDAENFRQILVKNKIRVMLRKSKGMDIAGACGQLQLKTSLL